MVTKQNHLSSNSFSSTQVQYAADDAFVGVASLLSMTIENLSTKPTFDVFNPGQAYGEVAEAAVILCQPFTERRFSNGNKAKSSNKAKSGEDN